ncbi:MAG TPA: L,D-transpeptidase [Ktedonobacterales bacterium]
MVGKAAGHRVSHGRAPRRASLVALALLLASVLLTACGGGADQDAAKRNKANLDAELTHARSDLGLPDSMLTSVTSQESKIATGEGGLLYSYGDAASNYAVLLNQLKGIEATAAQTLRTQAQADLDAFARILRQRRDDGFSEVADYQARYDQAQLAFQAATTAGEYAKVDATAQAQTAALQAMWPAYQKLQSYKAVLDSLAKNGMSTTFGQQMYDQDIQVFREASAAARYQALTEVIDAQIAQLLANQAAAQPYITASLLQSFQARIDLLRRYGNVSDAATFQQQHDQDAQQLASTQQLADYVALAQTIAKQDGALDIPLIKAKAQYDLTQLQQLISQASSVTIINPYDHKAYPAIYPYSDPLEGIGDASDRLKAAHTVAGYQAADTDLLGLRVGLQALLDNMRDPTAHDLAHATDLTMLHWYGVTSGKAIVISFTEQTARMYQNGNLVNWSYVTTGGYWSASNSLPSVPGYHEAMAKLSPTIFTSPDPVGSPDYYQPTPINYAIEYNDGGFFLHDAWWRGTFGPYTNLPHHDPAAFNGGSHGCINFPLAFMPWLYEWTSLGTPIIVY